MNIISKILIILLITASSFAEVLTVSKGKDVFIALEIPEGKSGGGDFYNIRIEPESELYSYKMTDAGIVMNFSKSGDYKLSLIINHITKSSCASVNVEPYETKDLSITVSK